MKMKSCLLIMNGREIPECVDAFKALKIPKIWLRAYRTSVLGQAATDAISSTSFDNYLINSDDTIPTQAALDAVLETAERHEVCSGWCNVSPDKNLAALILQKLTSEPPTERSYPFITLDEVAKLPEEFEAHFTGNCFFSMRRNLWDRFPMVYYRKKILWTRYGRYRFHGSDYSWAFRLQQAEIPIIVKKSGFVLHLNSLAHMIAGIETPQTIFDLEVS